MLNFSHLGFGAASFCWLVLLGPGNDFKHYSMQRPSGLRKKAVEAKLEHSESHLVFLHT